MIRRFFIWRLRRREKRLAYAIDQRHFRPLFGPGFFGFLDQSRFWQSCYKGYHSLAHWRGYLISVILFTMICFLAWVTFESIQFVRNAS